MSIVIPCYNEDENICNLLDLILEQQFPIDSEIIIVDDGSRTPVTTYIKKYLQDPRFHHFRFRRNQGKGSALQIGFKKSKGDYVIIQDADLEYLPSDINELLKLILDRKAFVVYGSRFFLKPKKMSRSHWIANRFLSIVTNVLFNSKLTDMETGYKLVNRRLLTSLHLVGREFEIEPEITGRLLARGVPIVEVPIHYHYRQKGIAKINIADGLEAVFMLLLLKTRTKSRLLWWLYRVFKYHFKKILVKYKKIIQGLIS
ncbi:MAG TPA: glycosyltransferase family 2 protein [Candidatus Lokiarchaeia archaeon]|nr:glycosyltransferase family 2 protein [Candidatus Lokiarchaeia archaeon]